MGDRNKLPPRRPSVTRDVIWTRATGGAHAFSVTIGFDPVTGEVVEVFASPARGSDIDATISDACVLISYLLQHGVDIHELAASMLQVSDPSSGGDGCFHASVQGAIVAAVAEAVTEWESLSMAKRSMKPLFADSADNFYPAIVLLLLMAGAFIGVAVVAVVIGMWGAQCPTP